MPPDLINDKATLVQVMAWCHQATSHYLTSDYQDIWCHKASLGNDEFMTEPVAPSYHYSDIIMGMFPFDDVIML